MFGLLTLTYNTAALVALEPRDSSSSKLRLCDCESFPFQVVFCGSVNVDVTTLVGLLGAVVLCMEVEGDG